MDRIHWVILENIKINEAKGLLSSEQLEALELYKKEMLIKQIKFAPKEGNELDILFSKSK